MNVRSTISLVFFILKLGKIVIVKEEKLSIKLESFFIVLNLNTQGFYPIEKS